MAISGGGTTTILCRTVAALFGTVLVIEIAAAQLAGISISSIQPIGFGTIVAGSVGGDVTISTSGNRTCGGSTICVPSVPGQPARFEVTGEPGATYNISFPSAATLSDGKGSSMIVDSFTAGSNTRTIGASGSDSLSVGATLRVGSNQTAGDYSGTFEVVIEYQ